MALIFLIVLTFMLAANATPVANYPVNAQLPPVARVSESFKFAFAESTFSNRGSGTKYSLSKAPSWLHIDSSSRTLSGTPSSKDAGPTTFSLVATDESGSANMDVTLVVSTDKGPEPGKPLLSQLAKFGPTSAPSTIFLYPGNYFSFYFEHDIFDHTGSDTIYYATSPDNSPLPSWIGFDSTTLKFFGNSPSSPSSGPQGFTFQLVASDVAGFSAATVSFDIVVGQHILAFKNSTKTVCLDKGKKFTSPNYRDILTLDGKAPASDSLASIDADAPDWLTLDTDTISLTGTPPDDVTNTNVTITVTDTYQDVAKLVLTLEFSQPLRDGVKECEAAVGSNFACPLKSGDDVQLHVDLGQDVSSWMRYNPSNKTLYGHVPTDLKPQTYSVDVTAKKGSTENTQTLAVKVVKEDEKENADQSSESSGSGSGIHGKKAGIIAIAIVIPFAVISSLIILFCCWRRKRRAANVKGENVFPKEKKGTSRPEMPELLHCQPFEETMAGERPRTSGSPVRPSNPPPKLELARIWSEDSFGAKEQTGNMADEENQLSKSAIDWGFVPLSSTEGRKEKVDDDPLKENKRLSTAGPPVRRRTTNYSRKREPLKPIQPRSLKRDSAASSKSRRNSKRSSGIPSIASGLPMRLSGAGHGAGGFGPPGHGVVRMSWQNTQMSLQSDESSLGNLAPLFPRPPPARTRNSISGEPPKRMSLRTVEPSQSIISEAESLEAFVHSRAKSRNSANPLFSAQVNHRKSSSLRAFEKARSVSSRADTSASNSIDSDEVNQERPYSTTMSASVYTEDNRHSIGTHAGPFSRYSTALSMISASKEQSQSNLAHGYSDVVAPLSQFSSEASLGSRRCDRGASADSDSYHDLIDERHDPQGQRR